MLVVRPAQGLGLCDTPKSRYIGVSTPNFPRRDPLTGALKVGRTDTTNASTEHVAARFSMRNGS